MEKPGDNLSFVSGIEDKTPRWYVAFVKSCQEKKTRDALERLSVGNYLPCRKVRRRWSDRIKVVEEPVLPRMIFVRAAGEKQRKNLLMDVFGLCGYMMDPATGRPAVVRDSQVEEFRAVIDRMNGAEDGRCVEMTIEKSYIAPGDMVEVIAGPFKGMRTECVENARRAGKPAIVVRLGVLGTAVVQIEEREVRKIDLEDNDTDKRDN